MKLSIPKTNLQEVLYTLIKQRYVSIFDYPYMSGFRTRVSELKIEQLLPIHTTLVKGVNKFGNTYHYAVHKLKKNDVEMAKELYNKLQE